MLRKVLVIHIIWFYFTLKIIKFYGKVNYILLYIRISNFWLQPYAFVFDRHSRVISFLICFHDFLLFLFLEVLIQLIFSYLSVPGFAACHNSIFVSVLSKQNKIILSVKFVLKKKWAGQNYNGTNFRGYQSL